MKIAIVGATGLVGTNIINLCEQYFDVGVEYSLFASKSSEGKKIKINDKELTVKELNKENIGEYNIALFSAGGERSKYYAHNFIEKGSFVVDNSSVFRMNDEVPLVVYGINENIITEESKLISNPNCTTMGLVMALKPLHDKYTLSSMTPVVQFGLDISFDSSVIMFSLIPYTTRGTSSFIRKTEELSTTKEPFFMKLCA